MVHALSYSVILTRAKIPANTGNFSCSSHIKRPQTQFTCVTSSLPAKTGKFPSVYGLTLRAEFRFSSVPCKFPTNDNSIKPFSADICNRFTKKFRLAD